MSEPRSSPRGGPARDDEWDDLARAAAGESDAFRRVVERHQDRLLALCERLLGSRDEALDACQEVFLKVYRHAGRAEPKGRLFTWLYRIAVNHCLNRLRRRRVVRFLSFSGPDTEESDAAEVDPPSEEPDPYARLESRDRWRRTRRVLDALPESQRAVVVLSRFEGLSQKEIAATLAITEGAVESRLVRAMRRLAAAQEEPTAWVTARRGAQ